MPRKAKSGYKKKAYRRRKRANKKIGAPNSYFGFPSNKVVKLRYHEIVNETSAGFSLYYNLIANGLYDPNYSGGGHQPLGYDQWTQFYNHYVVLGSKISVKIIVPVQTAFTQAFQCALKLTDDPSAPTFDNALFEGSKTRWKTLSPSTTHAATVTVGGKYSAKKFFNLGDVKDNVTRIGAPNGNNPTDIAVYQIVLFNQMGGGIPENITYEITIDYIVSWSEPKELTIS